MVSFILAAVTCAFSAFSYAELAGSIPVSGSSYSYAYATLGELIAWVCGWCLMLEYGSRSPQSRSVGAVPQQIPECGGIEIPAQFANPPGEGGGVFNIPAVVVVLCCAFLLLRGASESAKVNTIMVFLKIGILLFFCVIAFTTFTPGTSNRSRRSDCWGSAPRLARCSSASSASMRRRRRVKKRRTRSATCPGHHPVADHRHCALRPCGSRRDRCPALGGVRGRGSGRRFWRGSLPM